MILSCDSTAATVRLCSGRDVEHLQGQKAASWQAALPGHPGHEGHPVLPACLSHPSASQKGCSRPSPSLCQGTCAPLSPKPCLALDTQRVVPAPHQPGLPAADLSSETGRVQGFLALPQLSVCCPQHV